MSYHSRRILTSGASRKRKESEPYFPSTSSKPFVQQTAVTRAVSVTKPATASSGLAEPKPLSSNRLLAGCLAHEFLTKGTLFGEKFDPARAEALPLSSAEPRRNFRLSKRRVGASSEAEPGVKPKPQSYAEVANLLKGDGAHIPGVVNPTQLARWIQM